MNKTSSLLKKLITKPLPEIKTNTIEPAQSTSSKYMSVPVFNGLSPDQVETVLPFKRYEPLKQKESPTSKSKTFGRFFKKITNKTIQNNKAGVLESRSNTECTLVVIPIVKKKASKIQLSKESNKLSWNDSDISTLISEPTAEKIEITWSNSNSIFKTVDRVVDWIGDGSEASNSIIKTYMALFDFKALHLEQAFRKLCLNLPLQGEAQQIYRVLSEFSIRFYECNPTCVFGNSDIIFTLVNSLVLLNANLHVKKDVEAKKMCRSEYVNNTMNVIRSQLHTPALKGSSESFLSLDFIPLQRTPSQESSISTKSSIYAQSLDTYTSYIFGSRLWQLEIKNLLKQMFSSISHNKIGTPDTFGIPSRNNSRINPTVKRRNTTRSKTTGSMSRPISIVSNLGKTEIPTIYTCNAPYYKEGMLARKHLLESDGQKAQNREWKECFMVVERSQLRMYKLEDSDAVSQISSSASTVIGGGDCWMSSSQLLGTIDLKHTLATALPTGYSRQRKFAFAIHQVNGGVFIFQAESSEQVSEWVSSCNYWAARESKEPLVKEITTVEYGWGLCLETIDDEDVSVHDWTAPVPSTISSSLEESDQLQCLVRTVQDFVTQLDLHHEIKPFMENCFNRVSKSGTKAMANWETKNNYLLREIIKYQNYCDCIEKSLSLQAQTVSN